MRFTIAKLMKQLKKEYKVASRSDSKKSLEEIMQLVSLVDNDKAIEIPLTTKGVNRGGVVECITRLIVEGGKEVAMCGKLTVDMICNGIKYDIKYCSNYSLGNAPDINSDYVLQFAKGQYHLIKSNEVITNAHDNTCVNQPNEIMIIEPSKLRETIELQSMVVLLTNGKMVLGN